MKTKAQKRLEAIVRLEKANIKEVMLTPSGGELPTPEEAEIIVRKRHAESTRLRKQFNLI